MKVTSFTTQQQTGTCTSRGPDYTVGDIEWMCRQHDCDLDRDPTLMGQPHTAGGWSCPVSHQPVAVPSAKTAARKAKKVQNKINREAKLKKLQGARYLDPQARHALHLRGIRLQPLLPRFDFSDDD